MPTLMQHVQPWLNSLQSVNPAHPKSQRSSSMPTTTDSSKASWLSVTETHTLQQLALMLGRKGLEHAAISMQQHQLNTQHLSNPTYSSRLSWELLSSMSWLPGWCKHQAPASGHLGHKQTSAASVRWYADDLNDEAVEREMAAAQQQRMVNQGVLPKLSAVIQKEAVNLYTTHMPRFHASKSTWLMPNVML